MRQGGKLRKAIRQELDKAQEKCDELTTWLVDHPNADYKAWKKVSDDLAATQVRVQTAQFKLEQLKVRGPILGESIPDSNSHRVLQENKFKTKAA